MTGLKKDISSAERLLNIIRGKEDGGFLREKKDLSLPKKGARKIGTSLIGGFFEKKLFVVGVDIGSGFVALVKTSKANDSLLDYKVIQYDPNLSSDSAEFKSLLKSALINFCGVLPQCEVWAKISAGEVNVHFLKVPRAQKGQMGNVVYWTARKEGLLDESRMIFDFEIQSTAVDQDSAKQSVMLYTAPRAEVEKVKSLFSDIDVPLTGMTTVPFAMQNLFRSGWMPMTEEVFASLFIGENYSRIDVYHRENLVMTRGIKTGSSSSMADAIVSSVMERTGGLKLEKDEARKILFSMTPESDRLKMSEHKEFRKEEILEMISPVWERLARQVDLTLKTSSIGGKRVEKIYVLSSVNMDKSILHYMSEQLGSATEFFDPFKQKKMSSKEQSLSVFDRILLSPALGLSLSCNSYTPNFLYPYEEKKKEDAQQKLHKIARWSFLAALAGCLVLSAQQGIRHQWLIKERDRLNRELSLFNPLLSPEIVQQAMAEAKQYRSNARRYARRYLLPAAIGEMSRLTPQHVRLLNFRFVKDAPLQTTDAAGKAAPGASDGVILEGILSGERNALDTLLGQYAVTLDQSPIFSNVKIQKQEIVKFKDNDVMHFIIQATIG